MELKLEIQVLSHISHISSVQKPHVASGYCITGHRSGIFSSLPQFLLDSNNLGYFTIEEMLDLVDIVLYVENMML